MVHTGNVHHPGFCTDVPSAPPGCRPQPLKCPVPSPLQNHAEQNYGQSVMLFYFALSFSCTQGMHHVNYISVLHIQVNTFALLQSDSHLGLPQRIQALSPPVNRSTGPTKQRKPFPSLLQPSPAAHAYIRSSINHTAAYVSVSPPTSLPHCDLWGARGKD